MIVWAASLRAPWLLPWVRRRDAWTWPLAGVLPPTREQCRLTGSESDQSRGPQPPGERASTTLAEPSWWLCWETRGSEWAEWSRQVKVCVPGILSLLWPSERLSRFAGPQLLVRNTFYSTHRGTGLCRSRHVFGGWVGVCESASPGVSLSSLVPFTFPAAAGASLISFKAGYQDPRYRPRGALIRRVHGKGTPADWCRHALCPVLDYFHHLRLSPRTL